MTEQEVATMEAACQARDESYCRSTMVVVAHRKRPVEVSTWHGPQGFVTRLSPTYTRHVPCGRTVSTREEADDEHERFIGEVQAWGNARARPVVKLRCPQCGQVLRQDT